MPASAENSPSDLGAGIGCLAVLAIIAAGVWWILPDSWTDPIKYSWIYDKVKSSNVLYSEKPKDCDFMHAPLGDKACHYKKIINGFNAEGYLILCDNAPCSSNEKQADNVVVKVEVDWVKVTD